VIVQELTDTMATRLPDPETGFELRQPCGERIDTESTEARRLQGD
jgi:hypothetical protein